MAGLTKKMKREAGDARLPFLVLQNRPSVSEVRSTFLYYFISHYDMSNIVST
jgi:hypothetical protein